MCGTVPALPPEGGGIATAARRRRQAIASRRLRLILVSLLLAGTLGVSAGCDPLRAPLATFAAGYLLGRWEATRVEVVTVERICYQDGVRIACP